jgi:hypothetical protein
LGLQADSRASGQRQAQQDSSQMDSGKQNILSHLKWFFATPRRITEAGQR